MPDGQITPNLGRLRQRADRHRHWKKDVHRAAGFRSLAAMPPVSPSRRRCFGPRVIRVDDALCGAARCGGIALCQRGIAALKIIVVPALVYLQADRIGRVVGLGASRRRCRYRRDQNCKSQTAHENLPGRLTSSRSPRHVSKKLDFRDFAFAMPCLSKTSAAVRQGTAGGRVLHRIAPRFAT